MPGGGADIFFYTVAAIMVVLVAWFFLSNQDDKLRGYKVAFLAACVMAAVGIKVKKEADMRTIMVPIEVTETQYQALESIALHDDVQGTVNRIASAAVTVAADDATRQIADQYMPRTRSFASAETADAEAADMLARIEGGKLTASLGIFYGPSGKESWYNLPMEGVVSIMRHQGYTEERYPYWVREDGVKMLGPFVMCAAELNSRPRGSIIDTSLGEAIVCDTGPFVMTDPTAIDIATEW